jgi:DNA-binding transcriptional MerR regulator
MDEVALSLNELAEASKIEPRTIRSYIEKGLLPNAETKGRGATYSAEHLDRLKVIQFLRRARPGDTLNDIRLHLQKLSPQQITALAAGSISAGVFDSTSEADEKEEDHEDDVREVVQSPPSEQLTEIQRLVVALKKMGGHAQGSVRAESWHKIAVTEDIELSVRAEFGPDQLAVFKELALILRDLLRRTELPNEGDE